VTLLTNRKALLVYKKSLYQIYVEERDNTHIKYLILKNDPTVRDMIASHKANQEAIEHVHKVLEKSGFSVRTRYRGDAEMQRDADVVFSVGGDGTFLWTQKYLGSDIPIFGVNSDPGRSVGYLCTADKTNFAERLNNWLLPENVKTFGSPMARKVQRLKFSVNGTMISNRVLNDVLFCHKNPAAMSSYFLNDEAQKSSGVWFSTSVGSTGAIKSAGGLVMEWHDQTLQYKVREPYVVSGGKYKNSSGLIEKGKTMTLVSKMREAIVAPDGARNLCHIKMGDIIEISHSDEPLTWIKL